MRVNARTTRLVLTIGAVTTAVAACAATPLAPSYGEPQRRMAKAVDETVERSVVRLISPQDTLRLLLVARQYAIASSCDGFALEDERFSAVMASITGGLQSKTAPGQNNLPVDVVRSGYATTVGGQLAIAAYDQPAFCAEAVKLQRELQDDKEGRVYVLRPVK